MSKLWVTSRRFKGGRVITWRDGRLKVYAAALPDETLLSYKGGLWRNGDGLYVPALDQETGEPYWHCVHVLSGQAVGESGTDELKPI